MRLQPENPQQDLNGHHPGLYVHVPFCKRKCAYCGFYSVEDRDLVPSYLEALGRELAMMALPAGSFDTLYIGGGTPSVLKPSELEWMLSRIRERIPFAASVETTIELNPGVLTRDTFKVLLAAGVNRFNVGVQSFDDGRLRFLGRPHSAQQGREALDLARLAGVENLGIDLIYGLPGQGVPDWRRDLEAATSERPEHISCYMLTYEEGTPMARRRSRGDLQPRSERVLKDLFELTVEHLAVQGYQHYEISNFAREIGFRSRHNQKYWRHDSYLGLGPSAHSFVKPKRWWHDGNLTGYVDRLRHGEPPPGGAERLRKEQLMLESIFLGLRTCEGIRLSDFECTYAIGFAHRFAPLLRRLERESLVSNLPDRCVLTMKGMVLSDAVFREFAYFMEEQGL